jgi:hypothetical protein
MGHAVSAGLRSHSSPLGCLWRPRTSPLLGGALSIGAADAVVRPRPPLATGSHATKPPMTAFIDSTNQPWLPVFVSQAPKWNMAHPTLPAALSVTSTAAIPVAALLYVSRVADPVRIFWAIRGASSLGNSRSRLGGLLAPSKEETYGQHHSSLCLRINDTALEPPHKNA